ncbi:MAG: type II toxin-antitoxin system RatA family toxin [Alphaproteobacteria bacterium]|nr:type II toxin-antitoxin system RatA family toxin [Alphaproteobacteria bacterium]
MPTHQEKRIVPYSPEQLFGLVMDIEKYPEFLPWCIGARVNERKDNNVSAEVIVGYKVLREKFVSRVHFEPNKEIEVEYLKGPMRHLHNKWVFRALRGGQCEVDFYVDFSLNTKLLEKLVDQFFQRALVKMINAFEARALALYGGNRH